MTDTANPQPPTIPLPDEDHQHHRVEFAPVGAHGDKVHLFSKREIRAINAAIAAGRPLLVLGEPGTGKSQLARAAAKQLGWAFVKHVVDSHSESRDLLWTFDAVQRLADAQIAGARQHPLPDLRRRTAARRSPVEPNLAVENYLHPGPLWWAFNWDSASEQCRRARGTEPAQHDKGDWAKGCVFLLDEIDKAESEVPNGLLEALGAREFTPLGRRASVHATDQPLLVVITSNEERTLPDAFLRRCLVIRLDPFRDEEDPVAFLMTRGQAHFPNAHEDVRRKAAEMLLRDRQIAIAQQLRPYPGQAEYLDLLRIVLALAPGDVGEQKEMLGDVADYALKKQPGAEPAA